MLKKVKANPKMKLLWRLKVCSVIIADPSFCLFIIPILFVSILRFHSAELKTKKAIGHIMTVPEAE